MKFDETFILYPINVHNVIFNLPCQVSFGYTKILGKPLISFRQETEGLYKEDTYDFFSTLFASSFQNYSLQQTTQHQRKHINTKYLHIKTCTYIIKFVVSATFLTWFNKYYLLNFKTSDLFHNPVGLRPPSDPIFQNFRSNKTHLKY